MKPKPTNPAQKQLEEQVKRTVQFIATLSPWNYERGEAALYELLEADRQALLEEILAEGPKDYIFNDKFTVPPEKWNQQIEERKSFNATNKAWRTLLQKHKNKEVDDARG